MERRILTPRQLATIRKWWGEWLKQELTQEEMSDKMGYNPTYISNLEIGQSRIGPKFMDKLRLYLKLAGKEEWLRGDIPEAPESPNARPHARKNRRITPPPPPAKRPWTRKKQTPPENNPE